MNRNGPKSFLEDHRIILQAWVVTVFWVARMHLARPDLGVHAHVSPWLGLSYYARKMRALKGQWF